MTARIRRDAEDNMSEMDRAQELLKMKTVKIQQAARPEVSRSPEPTASLCIMNPGPAQLLVTSIKSLKAGPVLCVIIPPTGGQIFKIFQYSLLAPASTLP